MTDCTRIQPAALESQAQVLLIETATSRLRMPPEGPPWPGNVVRYQVPSAGEAVPGGMRTPEACLREMQALLQSQGPLHIVGCGAARFLALLAAAIWSARVSGLTLLGSEDQGRSSDDMPALWPAGDGALCDVRPAEWVSSLWRCVHAAQIPVWRAAGHPPKFLGEAIELCAEALVLA